MAKEVTRADLQRLWKDWQRQADVAARAADAHDATPAAKRIAQMQIRVLDGCIADMRELLEGKTHPAARRAGER